MSRYRLAPDAELDVDEISAFIALHDTGAANRFLDRAYAAFARLADRPHLGHRRPDLTRLPVLFWPLMGRYLIVYEATRPLNVVRVLSGYRDIAALLG